MTLRDRIYGRVRPRFQNARADLFVGLLQPSSSDVVLDLGGGDGGFARLLRDRIGFEITVADIGPRDLADLRYVELSDTDRLPFGDNAFDIVFCNSVIEHVTERRDVPEAEWQRASRRRQLAFADEVRRVGRAYFVQTPHRGFPFETHALLPLVNTLSHRATNRLLAVASRVWPSPAEADWRLLDETDMQSYFPDATIHVERFVGLPKSVIAYRR
jgi:hypothetical protein